MNQLNKLHEYGQSYWLDNLTREKIKSGELKRRVEEEGLRGITTNPAIFNKAISDSNDYDEQINQLFNEGKSIKEIYEGLTIKDVQDACDLLSPVYHNSDHVDGFVSIEVSPKLARDSEGTMLEARRLHEKVNRPNCYIKIPGTDEGISAIEQLLYEGININITLLFSIDSYEKVANAYIRALERRESEGKSNELIRSVASFFISRIDTLADEMIKNSIVNNINGMDNNTAEKLLGFAGISSAKIAYQSFKRIFDGELWNRLAAKGAKVQRPLWASTSTKNPSYRDVIYVESLIGENTVNTMPDETIEAFKDHGIAKINTIEKDINLSQEYFAKLDTSGIDINLITSKLVVEGIDKFIVPYENLLKTIENKVKLNTA